MCGAYTKTGKEGGGIVVKQIRCFGMRKLSFGQLKVGGDVGGLVGVNNRRAFLFISCLRFCSNSSSRVLVLLVLCPPLSHPLLPPSAAAAAAAAAGCNCKRRNVRKKYIYEGNNDCGNWRISSMTPELKINNPVAVCSVGRRWVCAKGACEGGRFSSATLQCACTCTVVGAKLFVNLM